MVPITRLPIAGAWALVALGAPAVAQADDDTPPCAAEEKLCIGVPHASTATGERHLQGVRDALAGHPLEDEVEIVPLPYLSDRAGDELLAESIDGGHFDLILGPTDSGPFVAAASLQADRGERNVPVISSLVTADVPNDPEGWFFRTNAGVRRRSAAVYDHLNQHWVRSLAVLHADTEFGRQAADAFRANLSEPQRGLLIELPFDPPNVRREVRQVLDARPEAVGVLGGREDVVACYRALANMNESGTPFSPMLFTIIDLREVQGDVDGFFFASVVRPDAEEPAGGGAPWDDVRALSYDTTRLVLDELVHVRLRPFDKVAFRDRFANLLAGAGGRPDLVSDMRFASMESSASLTLYRLASGGVEAVDAAPTSFVAKVLAKLALQANRFGLWPIGVLLTILVTVTVMSVHDLYRWYGGRVRQLVWRRWVPSRHFVALVALQAGVAILLYLFLGETGRIRYDSLVNGFIIALAPSPLLRANFGRIGGRELGFADAYDRLLKNLTGGLLRRRYRNFENSKLILAYYNTLGFLRGQLMAVYRALPNRDEGQRLLQELENDLAATALPIERRKLCAERLMQLRTWDDLRSMGCVPRELRAAADNVEAMIHECVRHCLGDERRTGTLHALVKSHLDRSTDAVRAHYEGKGAEAGGYVEKQREAGEEEAAQITASRETLYIDVQFLVMHFGFDRSRLEAEGLLPSEERVDEVEPAPRRAGGAGKKRARRKGAGAAK